MPAKKEAPKVYLAVSHDPKHLGLVLAVFFDRADADEFVDHLDAVGKKAKVEPRTLWYGQCEVMGYNK